MTARKNCRDCAFIRKQGGVRAPHDKWACSKHCRHCAGMVACPSCGRVATLVLMDDGEACCAKCASKTTGRPCARHKSHTCPEETVFAGGCCPCCGWTTDRCPRIGFDEANGIGASAIQAEVKHDG